MSDKKIAIQGELGAYSHIAAENLYKGAKIKTCAVRFRLHCKNEQDSDRFMTASKLRFKKGCQIPFSCQ